MGCTISGTLLGTFHFYFLLSGVTKMSKKYIIVVMVSLLKLLHSKLCI